MIRYSEELKGRTVLWRPAKDSKEGVREPCVDWCDPRVKEGKIIGYQEFGGFFDVLCEGRALLIAPENLTLGRKAR